MNRFWIALAVLFSVNLMASDPLNADDVLKHVEISPGINLKRKLNVPGTITRRYLWHFENSDYTVLMAIDNEQYNTISNYNTHKRHGWNNFHSIVQESTKALRRLVDEFREVMPQTWTKERKVNFMLAFVQSLAYTDDVTTGYNEFYKYAIETLVERGGDCEDTSVLFASILNGLGFEVALIIPPGHLAVGVKGNFRGGVVSYKNNNYYYCETTGIGWQLGQVPDDYKGKKATIMPITLARPLPKQVNPQVNPPVPPRPNPSPLMLVKGINQFETELLYEKAIESFKYALNRDGLNSKQRALAHLYWGCSELARTNRTDPNYDNYVHKAKEQFSKVFRHDPYQELPSRLYSKKKIRTVFEEARKESIGELTVTALPQTDIWIDRNGINRKISTGTVSIKLFKGTYTVKGIYKGESIEKIVTIEPNRHERCVLEILVVDNIPPIIRLIKPDGGATFKVNQRITITAEVADDTSVKEVYVHFPSDSYELSKERSSDIYTKVIWGTDAGTLRYYLTATDEAGNERRYPKTGKLRIIVTEEPDDETPPIIRLIKPDTDKFEVNKQITIAAEVADDTSVKEVYVHFPSDSYELSKERSSDIYTKVIWGTDAGTLRYYLTATDEAGNERRYPKTGKLRIIVTEEPDDETPPIIRLIKPDTDKFEVNKQITIAAEVTDNISVKEVFVHFSPTDKRLLVKKQRFPDTYTRNIWEENARSIWYYLTATDEAGNKSRYPKTGKLKITVTEEPKDETPPIIRLIKPDDGATFKVNQRITITAEVADDTSVKEVYVHFPSDSYELSKERSSDIYTKVIWGTDAGTLRYYLTATDEAGNERRYPKTGELRITVTEDPYIVEPHRLYKGIWLSYALSSDIFNNVPSALDWDRGNMLRLAFLLEGKTYSTLGGQLNFSHPDRMNANAMIQWGPALGKSNIAFTVLGGIAEYEDFPARNTSARSTHMTPLLGAGLKFYLWDKIAIDGTSSFKIRSDYDTTDLYHYAVGIRFYNIYRALSLRVGYGRWYLGDRSTTGVQIGLGYTF